MNNKLDDKHHLWPDAADKTKLFHEWLNKESNF